MLWILKYYLRPIIKNQASTGTTAIGQKFQEDLYKVKEYLALFDANKPDLKRRGLSIDIMQYKSIQDLFTNVQPYKESSRSEEAESHSELITNRYYIDTGAVDVLVDNESDLIIRIKSYAASKFYGCLTEWCTAFPDMYQNYSSTGFLFMILDKGQLTAESLPYGVEPNAMIQIYLQFDGSQLESRDMHDDWNTNDALSAYRDTYQVAFDTYLKAAPEYTYDPRTVKKFHIVVPFVVK